MKKAMRYLAILGAIIFIGLAIINLPVLLQAMLSTIVKVSWEIWAAFLLGLVLGSIATGFATKQKKVDVNDNSFEN